MNIKTLLIMGIAGFFNCSGNINAQNNQESSKVMELTNEQKLKLLELSNPDVPMMQPGICEWIEVEKREAPLPWKFMRTVPEYKELKEWICNVRLEIVNTGGTGDDYRLSLHGKYIPATPIEEGSEHLQSANEGNSSGTLKTMEIRPVEMLENVRAKFTSHLEKKDGTPLEFFYWDCHAHISGSKETATGEQQLEFKFLLSPEVTKDDCCKGHIDMQLLPPYRWKYTQVSLAPTDEGNEYEFDSVKFKIVKSVPGDMILTYDKKDNDKVKKWSFIPVKGGTPLEITGATKYIGSPRGVLYYYNHSELEFGAYLYEMLGLNCKKLGITPEALKSTVQNNYQPTADEILKFHEMIGELIGKKLNELMNIDAKEYDDFYKEWIRTGYKTYREFEEYEFNAANVFRERYGDENRPFVGYMRGVDIGAYYEEAGFSPDWNIIDSSAIAFLERCSNMDVEEMDKMIQKHTEDINSLLMKRETLSFITEKDIEYLAKELPEEESSQMYYWYKTNTDADSIYIYIPDKKANNEAILNFRFYLDERKPEIIPN